MYINPQYRQDLFRGTSEYYSQYRMPYNESMIEEIIKIANIGKNDNLLDLACGPGRLAIPLSKYFKGVYAIDWEKEMIEEGERISNKLKIENIEWINGKAEELNFESETLKMITIGDAFHRMDQFKILQNSYRVLKNSGYLVLIYSVPITKGNYEWQKELNKILSQWDTVKVQKNKDLMQPWDVFLKETGFKNVSSKIFEEIIMLDIENIIGYLYSMSVYSKNVIGDEYKIFENKIKEGLLKIVPDNRFEFIFECGYYIGKKE